MVKSLLDPSYVAGDRGAPPWVGDILASVIARTLPKGKLLTETEWRNAGVQQSRGWVHYACHRCVIAS